MDMLRIIMLATANIIGSIGAAATADGEKKARAVRAAGLRSLAFV